MLSNMPYKRMYTNLSLNTPPTYIYPINMVKLPIKYSKTSVNAILKVVSLASLLPAMPNRNVLRVCLSRISLK